MIYPILLCGGSGTRLWPLSRQSFTKQFVKLVGEESLFQTSASRFLGAGFQPPVIVTSDHFRFIVAEQLAGVSMEAAATLIEPEPRNTAPAILSSALWLLQQDPAAMMLVAPSDHVMPDAAGFRETVMAALPAARMGQIVTFGIVPTKPEIGYGYLELTSKEALTAQTPQPVASFVEKPDGARAEAMLAAGNYLWNAGIFLFEARTIVEAFKAYAPLMVSATTAAVEQGVRDLHFLRLAAKPWGELPSISIDYAIIEKATNLSVMPYRGSWSDLGSWDAVWQEGEADLQGNVCSSHALAIDCQSSMLRSEVDGLEVVGIGLTDMVVVAMPDAVLVAKKSDTQRVKEAVDALKARSVKQATSFNRDHRPWGWYESLAMGTRFQVKRIVVKPGAALSLQSHHHRAEHWIVVQGTAKVTVDNETRIVTENESTYIRLGAVHRLENPGKLPVILIEVQTGAYLGEDDIIRYEDVYARS